MTNCSYAPDIGPANRWKHLVHEVEKIYKQVEKMGIDKHFELIYLKAKLD